MIGAVNALVAGGVLVQLVVRINHMHDTTPAPLRLAHVALAVAVAWSGLAPLWDERGLQWADVGVMASLGALLAFDRRRRMGG